MSQRMSRIASQLPVAERGKERSSIRASRGSGALWSPDFGPLAPSTVQDYVAISISYPVWGTLLQLCHKLTSFSLSSVLTRLPSFNKRSMHLLPSLSLLKKCLPKAHPLLDALHARPAPPAPCLLLLQTFSHSQPPERPSETPHCPLSLVSFSYSHFSGPYNSKTSQKELSTPSLHSLTSHSPTST